MSALRVFAARALCGLILCLPAVPQQTTPPTRPRRLRPDPNRVQFKGSATEVIVPVTVTDDKGRFVSNLVKKDFRVLDEGKPQNIEFFSHDEKQPIVVGFLIDLSNNSRIHWKTYQDAILELVWNLLPGDKRYTGYLISYGNTADISVNTTWDSEKIADKVRKMKPGGGAALYDAIYLACTRRDLVKGEPYEPRRVIIVVGDGHDNASTHNLEEVLELAQRNLVTVYAVSTMAFGFSNESQDVLERLTHKTGGHVEYPLNSLYKDVSGLSFESFRRRQLRADGGHRRVRGGDLQRHHQGGGRHRRRDHDAVHSALPAGFRSRGKPKMYRKITVDIPGLPNVKISAREGYFPNEVPGATPAAAPARLLLHRPRNNKGHR